ncbi:MAG: hypothetical protein GY929_02395, partial [Actinomycetia bacterium]|nr:hypothetical protein [Actinomycetes bacterium]
MLLYPIPADGNYETAEPHWIEPGASWAGHHSAAERRQFEEALESADPATLTALGHPE